MWLYLPITPACNIDDPPLIDQDGPKIAHAVHTFQPPQRNDEENEEGGGRRRRRRAEDDPGLQAVESAHKDRPGWIPILAWSHGASSSSGRHSRGGQSNMQDLSMTKYSDNASPQMTVMVMVGEVLPHGILRVTYNPADGKIKVIEMVLKNVQISSISTGGSGGEDRLTENITVTFSSIFMRHVTINVADGKFLEDSKGSWDGETKKGEREGRFTVQSLKSIVKKAVSVNIDLYDTRALAKLPRPILEELDLSHISAQLKVPLKGRRLLFTAEEAKDGHRTRFREVYVKKLTVAAVLASIAAVLKVETAKVKAVYLLGDSALVQLERDEQVEDLAESDHIFGALE